MSKTWSFFRELNDVHNYKYHFHISPHFVIFSRALYSPNTDSSLGLIVNVFIICTLSTEYMECKFLGMTSKKDDTRQGWRRQYKNELYDFYSTNIIRFIKLRRIR